jgi:hypothetical protein
MGTRRRGARALGAYVHCTRLSSTRALSAAELLTAWEIGQSQSGVERATTLLAMADPTTPRSVLIDLPVGVRDGRLLVLRERVFGEWLAGLIDCPRCGERLTLDLKVADIEMAAPPVEGATFDLTADGYEVTFRLPTGRDLEAVSEEVEVGAAKAALLERCVIDARRQGDQTRVKDLPAWIVAAVTDRLAEADPQGDIRLLVACPTCGQRSPALLDIASFLWSELNAWAVRLLHEVHELASVYGWCERDILSMSAVRRQTYLAMVRK